MAITVIGSASNASTTGTSLNVTHGLTIAENDVLIAITNINGSAYTLTSDDSEFTSKIGQAYNGTSAKMEIWYRVAGASEPSEYAWTCNTSDKWGLAMVQLRGTNTSTIFDVDPAAGNFDERTGNPQCPSITVADDACGIVAHGSDSTGNAVTAIDNSYTLQEETVGMTCSISTRIFTTGGASGVTTPDLSFEGDVGAGFQFSIAVAGGTNTSILVPTGPLR